MNFHQRRSSIDIHSTTLYIPPTRPTLCCTLFLQRCTHDVSWCKNAASGNANGVNLNRYDRHAICRITRSPTVKPFQRRNLVIQTKFVFYLSPSLRLMVNYCIKKALIGMPTGSGTWYAEILTLLFATSCFLSQRLADWNAIAVQWSNRRSISFTTRFRFE